MMADFERKTYRARLVIASLCRSELNKILADILSRENVKDKVTQALISVTGIPDENLRQLVLRLYGEENLLEFDRCICRSLWATAQTKTPVQPRVTSSNYAKNQPPRQDLIHEVIKVLGEGHPLSSKNITENLFGRHIVYAVDTTTLNRVSEVMCSLRKKGVIDYKKLEEGERGYFLKGGEVL